MWLELEKIEYMSKIDFLVGRISHEQYKVRIEAYTELEHFIPFGKTEFHYESNKSSLRLIQWRDVVESGTNNHLIKEPGWVLLDSNNQPVLSYTFLTLHDAETLVITLLEDGIEPTGIYEVQYIENKYYKNNNKNINMPSRTS